jgi:hypothetical protein
VLTGLRIIRCESRVQEYSRRAPYTEPPTRFELSGPGNMRISIDE